MAVEDLDKKVDYVMGITDKYYQSFSESEVGLSYSVKLFKKEICKPT